MSNQPISRRSLLIAGASLMSTGCFLLRPGGVAPQSLFRSQPHRGEWPTTIEWKLYFDDKRKLTGEQPERHAAPIPLETLIPKEPTPNQLSEWQLPTLSRIVPLKRMIEKYAAHYAINPLWASMFFNFESLYNPTDVNTFSDDYGLGQIKRVSETYAKRVGTDPAHAFYCKDLDKSKSILDPQTNIIMAMLLHRHNIERHGLNNSDQVYAVYVRGLPGLNKDGSLSPLTKDILTSFRERYLGLEATLPLFKLTPEHLAKLDGTDTGAMLRLYKEDLGPEKTYEKQLKHYLGVLGKPEANARHVLMFDDAAVFAKALRIAYRRDVNSEYQALAGIGSSLQQQLKEKELQDRVGRTIKSLQG